jgi:hypothetical protein
MKKKLSVNISHYKDSFFWYGFAPCFFLASITFALYFPSLQYPFQFDDSPNILKFYDIRHKGFFDLFLTSSRWIFYWLNTLYYAISKFDPWYYRLGNIIFHCLTGMGVYHVSIRFFGYSTTVFYKQHAPLLAFLTAGLFLLHPVQTQTVSYVVQGQLEGMAAFFMIYTVLGLFLMHESTHKAVTFFWYVIVLLLSFSAS